MGKISTYANASPVTISDKFIGTEVAGTPVNVTKNFLISDLLTLFQSNITLQNVLDAGNTATQSIILTGDITQTGNLTQSGGALTLGGTVKDFNGSLGNNGETLVCNALGQLVFGSGLTNQNLSQVLAIGNTATNDINLTGNLNLTGNIVETGNIGLTGNITQAGDVSLTGNITQTGGNYGLTGNITQAGDVSLTGNITQTGGNYGLTGNITQAGNYGITGNITHIGAYSFSGGQFTMGATGTMVLGGALTCNSSISLTGTVKDYTDTLGAANQFLVSNASGQVTWQSTLPSSTTVDAAGDPSANADVIFYSASSGGGTVYLDSALNVAGKKVVLVRTSTTTAANIGANGGALVNGVSAKPLPTTLYSETTCISDGTDWYCNNGSPL